VSTSSGSCSGCRIDRFEVSSIFSLAFGLAVEKSTFSCTLTLSIRRARPGPEDEAPMSFIDYQASVRRRITLDRPEAANAQTLELLAALDEAWRRAADDPEVRVVVLQANGKHFSSGHDIKGVTPEDGWTLAGIYETEARRFLEYSLRWRNVPKPSIAAVQGVCIAGGLLLCWPCDLIIAADNATFSDPVVNMGIGGVEYAGNWGLAGRGCSSPAGDAAVEAERLGMVNQVDPRRTADRHAGPRRRDRDQAPVRVAPGQAGGQPDPRRPGLLRRHPSRLRHPPDRSRARAQ
jgi:enoyl-CoA hydratase/carnithine racemase